MLSFSELLVKHLQQDWWGLRPAGCCTPVLSPAQDHLSAGGAQATWVLGTIQGKKHFFCTGFLYPCLIHMHNDIFVVAWQPAGGILDGRWDLSGWICGVFSGSVTTGVAVFRLINI